METLFKMMRSEHLAGLNFWKNKNPGQMWAFLSVRLSAHSVNSQLASLRKKELDFDRERVLPPLNFSLDVSPRPKSRFVRHSLTAHCPDETSTELTSK